MNSNSKNITSIFIIVIAVVASYFLLQKPEDISTVGIESNTSSEGTDYGVYDQMLQTTNVATFENTYVGPGFIFNYQADAQVTRFADTATYAETYEIHKEGDPISDMIIFYPLGLPKDNWCRTESGGQSVVIEQKVFVYCDSTGDPTREYVYERDGKAVVIIIGLTQKMAPNYINLGSLEIL